VTERDELARRMLTWIDSALRVARHIGEEVTWEPNPEAVDLLIHAIDETRGVLGDLDKIMAAQLEED
jgi:hypothetical protein